MTFFDDLFGRSARALREAEDRKLILAAIEGMRETNVKVSEALGQAIRDIASVQMAQATAIKTHLDLFKGPVGMEVADETNNGVAIEPDSQTDADFPFEGSTEAQEKWLRDHMDDD